MKLIPVILTLMACLVLGSCKKDTAPAKETLVSRASYNGMTAYKFYYSDNNLLSKWELYKIDQTDNSVSTYYTFKYNDSEQLTELFQFSMPGGTPSSRIFFEYNQAGNVSKHTYYNLQGPDPSSPSQTGTFSYNAQNLLTTVTMKDGDGEFINRYSLTYYPNGFLKQRDRYEETITNQLRLVSRSIYSVPDTDEIKGWKKLTVIPLDGDELTRRVRYSTIQRYSYNNGVLTNNTSETMAGKEYNSDGTLERHTSTLNYVLPADPAIIVNWEYQYIVQ